MFHPHCLEHQKFRLSGNPHEFRLSSGNSVPHQGMFFIFHFLPKTFSDAPAAFSVHAQAQSRGCFQGQPSNQGEMRELDKYPIPILQEDISERYAAQEVPEKSRPCFLQQSWQQLPYIGFSSISPTPSFLLSGITSQAKYPCSFLKLHTEGNPNWERDLHPQTKPRHTFFPPKTQNVPLSLLFWENL